MKISDANLKIILDSSRKSDIPKFDKRFIQSIIKIYDHHNYSQKRISKNT